MEDQHLVHREGRSSHRDWDRRVSISVRKSSSRTLKVSPEGKRWHFQIHGKKTGRKRKNKPTLTSLPFCWAVFHREPNLKPRVTSGAVHRVGLTKMWGLVVMCYCLYSGRESFWKVGVLIKQCWLKLRILHWKSLMIWDHEVSIGIFGAQARFSNLARWGGSRHCEIFKVVWERGEWVQFSSVQFSLSVESSSLYPMDCSTHQASLSITNSRSLLKLMSIQLNVSWTNNTFMYSPLLFQVFIMML